MMSHMDLGLNGPTLMLGPLSVDGDMAEVATHRRLDCGEYDACLAVAQTHMWPGFTCRGCSRYCAVPQPRNEPLRSSPMHEWIEHR